jgi:hypothetical protein
MRTSSGDVFETSQEGIPTDGGEGLESDLASMRGKEGAELAEAERAAQQRVVSQAGVFVQRKVDTIHREVVVQEEAQELVAVAGPRDGGSPKKPVVDDQEIGSGAKRCLDGGASSVDGGSDPADRLAVLELEAVVGAVPVGEGSGWEEAIAEPDEALERYGVPGSHRGHSA